LAKPEKMTEEDLVRILRQEEADAASYHDSELAKAQEDGLNRYFGKPYGTEKEGRSKVVSHDIQDDVNSIMPDLMRCFASPDDLVSIEASNPEDDKPYQIGLNEDGTPRYSKKTKVDIQAAYGAHVFFKDNKGKENIYDFAFDGLVQRVGIMQVSFEPPEPKPPMEVEGVGPEQLAKYVNDPEYEILEQTEEQGPNGPVFALRVRRTPAVGRVYITAVPPEEFALTKTARNSKSSRTRSGPIADCGTMVESRPAIPTTTSTPSPVQMHRLSAGVRSRCMKSTSALTSTATALSSCAMSSASRT
jgi:hypothetical protein